MKITTFSIAVLFFLNNCSEAKNQNAMNLIHNVNAIEFNNLIQLDNGIVLDVRTPEEVAQGKIRNASVVNFYDKDFEKKINLIQKDKPIYIYCRSGSRSLNASKILEKNGFTKIYNLSGGISSWVGNGFSVEKPTQIQDDKIQEMSLAEFNKIIETKKSVLVDFHTKWCSPCIQMAPIVDEVSKEYQKNLTVIRIDIDKSKELEEAYNIQGVPVFYIFRNRKKEWDHSGLISKKNLIAAIERVTK
ncbi:MAG: thioredoxin domain-containing protein [Leptospiraceae bacterium]|nr:thioredoxin fold domain-containing protein [Leptospiraceae bacterium]MCK6382451.1 thioredoxin domain-containing protein [Leptospiraceae bacterium]NUM42528.1 thioredoxin fold domain-containing protein [Leptospiraceae bacterium]